VKDVVPTWKTYRNKEYNFEIKYPSDYSVSEGHPIKIIRSLNKERYSAGAVICLESDRVDFPALGISFQYSLSFRDFAGYTAREHCFCKGTMGMNMCDEIIEESPFILPRGIRGYKIYVNLTSCGVERDETGEIIEEECREFKKGPIFALDVSGKTNNKLRGIFIEPYLLISGSAREKEKKIVKEGEEAIEKNLNQILSTFKFIN